MIKTLQIADLTDRQYRDLSRLTLSYNRGSGGKSGYLEMYLHICRVTAFMYGKDDFRCHIYIYEEDGEILGWVMLQDLLYRYQDYMDMSIYVHEKARKKGIGRALVEYVIEKHSTEKVSAWVDEDNKQFFKWFAHHPVVYFFDSDIYHDKKQYVRYRYPYCCE